MIFEETPLPGALVVSMDRIGDERGFFARAFCQNEFRERGLPTEIAQSNTSFNRRKGTLRGMHFQTEQAPEPKLVRCIAGAVFDVLVDLRPDSPTYLKWYGRELTQENGEMLFVPVGLAHGFQTLRDDSEVFYQMFGFFDPANAGGVRWDDPAFAIEWPEEASRTISAKDQSYPDYQP